MKSGSSRMLWLVAAAILLIGSGIGALVLALRQTVTIHFEAQQIEIQTWTRTVGDALRQADQVFPELLPLPDTAEIFPPAGEAIPANGVIVIDLPVQATIWDGEQAYTHASTETILANFLFESGAKYFPGDALWVNGQPASPDDRLAGQPAFEIEIKPAKRVLIVGAQGPVRLTSVAQTVGQALAQAGIQVQAGDLVEPAPGTPLVDDLVIQYRPARQITVEVDGGQHTIISAGQTVGEVLADAGLGLQGLDRSDPPLDAPLPQNGTIRIQRVQESVVLEQNLLPIPEEIVPADDLPLDEIRVIQTGTAGLEVQRVRVLTVDGVEVQRTVESSWLARPAQPRQLAFGTQVTEQTVTTADGTFTYYRSVTMYATSYSPCRLGIPNYCNTITASGRTLTKGIVAMTRDWYRLFAGSQVYIPGYGIGVVADIGGGVAGRDWIDLGYEDANWQQWSQPVTVYFLWPPPGNVPWILP